MSPRKQAYGPRPQRTRVIIVKPNAQDDSGMGVMLGTMGAIAAVVLIGLALLVIFLVAAAAYGGAVWLLDEVNPFEWLPQAVTNFVEPYTPSSLQWLEKRALRHKRNPPPPPKPGDPDLPNIDWTWPGDEP